VTTLESTNQVIAQTEAPLRRPPGARAGVRASGASARRAGPDRSGLAGPLVR
jgi:hypothetical protein